MKWLLLGLGAGLALLAAAVVWIVAYDQHGIEERNRLMWEEMRTKYDFPGGVEHGKPERRDGQRQQQQ